jgi:hypothetical protein
MRFRFVGLMAHNSDVGSFEQRFGHRTYNFTDDLRAVSDFKVMPRPGRGAPMISESVQAFRKLAASGCTERCPVDKYR